NSQQMSQNAPAEKPEAFYFCDESSFVNEEFMAVGGLAIPKTNLKVVTDRIKEIGTGPKREEVKWGTTKHWNVDIRKADVDCLVDLTTTLRAHLHVRFAPFRQYDHDESGERRVFDTVSKMYYQLLLHRAIRHYGQQYRLLIRPDDGECTSELKKFVPALLN